MKVYDPYFAPDTRVLARPYDFITCSETAEHFFHPGKEFARLDSLLRPGGWLGVMTEILYDDRHFTDWWYVRDPTHVSFYRPETLEWAGGHFGWTIEKPVRNVVLFYKN